MYGQYNGNGSVGQTFELVYDTPKTYTCSNKYISGDASSANAVYEIRYYMVFPLKTYYTSTFIN